MTVSAALAWLANLFEEPLPHIQPDTKRTEIPAWDSLGMLTLMASLDEQFDIRLTDEEIPAMRSVADILTALRRRGKLS
jgi:acyl carrier protein